MKTGTIGKATALAALVILFFAATAFAAGQARKENPSEAQETLMGDVVADAMASALGADAAIINAGSLGTGALPDKISEDTLDSLVPYPDDSVVAVKLTGADLEDALEKSVSALPRRSSGFLQVSGITFTCDLNSKAGARVSNIEINGKAFSPKAIYTVALTFFLFEGGSGYVSLKNGKLVKNTETTLSEVLLKNAVIPENGAAGSRINIIQPEK